MAIRAPLFGLLLALGCGSDGDGFPDFGPIDVRDFGVDAQVDAFVDPEPDLGRDAGDDPMDAGTDGGSETDAFTPDAFEPDAFVDTCSGISVGDTLALDGTDDLAKYPDTQTLEPGGPLGSSDTYGITWDDEHLYVTLVSGAFGSEFKPVHVYLEAATTLGTATAADGKPYDSLTAELPFDATHLIAFRRTSLGGDGVAYNGVYVPGAAGDWETRVFALEAGTDAWVASGNDAMSVRVPWSALGCPTRLRLTAHVVNGPVVANEWKDFIPLSTTPWTEPGGGYYEIDLSADPDVAGWTERP